MHAAGWLGDKHPELWSELTAWLAKVYDAPVVPRRSLYYAPGKEPRAQQGAKTRGPQRTGAGP